MNTAHQQIFTVGHSNHSVEEFIALLEGHRVDVVVDVRSAPYSRYTPQFNHTLLAGVLAEAGIEYSFLGGELGGRPVDRSCYDADGRVNYERIAESEQFDDGMRRLLFTADENRVAVMCSEKEPLDCHRTLLIARALVERGFSVQHILADGSMEPHDDTINRLLDTFKLPKNGDMISTRQDFISEAVSRQAKRVAFADAELTGESRRRVH